MNESNGGPPPQRGFLHSSPKKKLSFRSQNKIEDVRQGLKNAKDISARNLMAKIDCDEGAHEDSESTIEEVVVIEEVTEEVEDDESVEYIEEIIDDSDDADSYLEPLPPPIEIPAALQVKDDDEEAPIDGSSSDDDTDDGDSEEDERKSSPPTHVAPAVKKESVVEEPVHKEPERKETIVEQKEPEQAAPVVHETTAARPVESSGSESNDEETADEVHEMNSHEQVFQANSVRPVALRGMSYATAEETSSPPPPVQEPSSQNDVPTDADSTIAWTKPDWTKNTKLRPTGKSTKENLAKPITILPHLKHGESSGSELKTPAAASKPKVKQAPKTPNPPSNSAPVTETACPKSAPSRPNAPVSMGNEDVPKIEWTKPDWTRKKVLRDTSKGQKILSGQEISRPIGGIRPVKD